MKILITGSSGFIGSALVESLKNSRHDVDCLDIKMQVHHKYPTIIHDLRTLLVESTTYDLIIHLAAHSHVRDSIQTPYLGIENITMTHSILDFARQNKIQKVLFASSREVYGDSSLAREGAESISDIQNPYAASKIAGEALCYSYSASYGVKCKVIRMSNVYGRYDLSDRFVPLAISALRRNRTFNIYGQDKTMDLIYIDDVVSGIETLVNKWEDGQVLENTYNIASGQKTNLVDIVSEMKSILQSDSTIEVLEKKIGEVSNFSADISQLKKLDWLPHTTLTEGLTKTIQWHTTQN